MFANIRHARAIFDNWTVYCTDPALSRFFFKKCVEDYACDPTHYNYWFVCIIATGVAAGVGARNMLFNPDLYWRRQERRKNMVDRTKRHMYSLNYYNTRLRQYAMRHTACVIDNEPDWTGDHPWSTRPNRQLSYKRYPWFLSAPKYYTDDPLFEKTLHQNVEKRYKAIGYSPQVKEDEEEEEEE